MALTRSRQILLEAVHAHDGEWNWYPLGRICLARLDSPADFTLRPLLDAGYVEEARRDDEPLPRLRVTPAIREAIRVPLASGTVAHQD